MMERLAIVTQEHLDFLDELRELGDTNMWGACSYLEKEFLELCGSRGIHSSPRAKEVLKYWMESFTERHPA